MAEIDRSEKFKIERLSKMVPIQSPECRQGTHAFCPGSVWYAIGGQVERHPVERGTFVMPDSIERPCGCPCHHR